MNTTELKAAESALETALEQVRQLIASDPEPKPKPKPEPVRGPLTAAPEFGAEYWGFDIVVRACKSTWDNDSIDRARLARGNVFASREDAEYKAAFDAIWGQPIGEWESDSVCWFVTFENTVWWTRSQPASGYLRRPWRKGEIGFGDAGKAELERRLAEQKALDERFGL